jgi:hypothetical protein
MFTLTDADDLRVSVHDQRHNLGKVTRRRENPITKNLEFTNFPPAHILQDTKFFWYSLTISRQYNHHKDTCTKQFLEILKNKNQ